MRLAICCFVIVSFWCTALYAQKDSTARKKDSSITSPARTRSASVRPDSAAHSRGIGALRIAGNRSGCVQIRRLAVLSFICGALSRDVLHGGRSQIFWYSPASIDSWGGNASIVPPVRLFSRKVLRRAGPALAGQTRARKIFRDSSGQYQREVILRGPAADTLSTCPASESLMTEI